MPFPIDEKYIVETEQQLGIEFPESFKRKMCVENGGEFSTEEDDWQLHPFYDGSDNTRIKRTWASISYETKEARGQDNFPKEAIAIASNGCGDNLVLMPGKDNQTKLQDDIYLWLHETGETIKIADTIFDLI